MANTVSHANKVWILFIIESNIRSCKYIENLIKNLASTIVMLNCYPIDETNTQDYKDPCIMD